MRLLYGIVIIACCFSCLSSQENLEVKPIAEIKIPLGNSKYNFDKLISVGNYTVNDTLFIVLVSANGNYLSYNTDLGKIDTIFNFNQKIGGHSKISALSFIDKDSALVIFRDQNLVATWNRKTMKLSPVANVPDFIFQQMKSSYQGLSNIGLLATALDPPRYLNGRYYIPKEIGFPIDPDSHMNSESSTTNSIKEENKGKLKIEYNKKVEDFSFLEKEASYFEIDPKKKKSIWIKYLGGFTPKSYLGKKTFLPMGHFRSNTIGENDNFLVSFFNSNSIFIYDTSGQVTTVESVKSKYIREFNPVKFYELKKNGKERVVTEPYYGTLLFDSHRKLYYRFVLHRQEYLKEDNIKVNTSRDRSFSVMVIDSNFSVLGEYFFNPNKYETTGSFVTEKGLFIRSLEEGREEITYHGFQL